jgi:3-hydroxybutyryl-CoA dehydratase
MLPTSPSDVRRAPPGPLDFAVLRVGDTMTTGCRRITEPDVVSFAALTGDWHPHHFDAEFARESQFGERIAHGLLLLACAIGLLPLDPDRVVALRRIRDAVFKAPARLGDTIRVRATITALRPLNARLGIVSFLWEIVNEHDRLLIRADVDVLWRRDPPGANGAARTPAGMIDRPSPPIAQRS